MNNWDIIKELFALRLRTRIDPRTVACQVDVARHDSKILIQGFTLFDQTDAFVRKTAADVFGEEQLAFDLKVLSRDFPLAFGEVCVAAAGFFRTTQIKSNFDLLTQALYGSIVRLFFKRDGFWLAQHCDGYIGLVPEQMIQPVDQARYLRWKNGPCARLRVPMCLGGVNLPPSCRLIYDDGQVELVGGERFAINPRQVKLLNPACDRFVKTITRHARVFSKTPYLWGGKTHEGIDCSGLMQSLFMQEHILLPRDANQQAHVGEVVGYLPERADLLPGDLVFFMNDDAHVFHVGLYVGNNCYMHSSFANNLLCSSFSPEGENHVPRFHGQFAFARRVRIG